MNERVNEFQDRSSKPTTIRLGKVEENSIDRMIFIHAQIGIFILHNKAILISIAVERGYDVLQAVLLELTSSLPSSHLILFKSKQMTQRSNHFGEMS